MNKKVKRVDVEISIKRRVTVLKNDVEMLEQLLKADLESYDGKTVNGWLEKRIKATCPDIYLQQLDYFKGHQYTLTSHKWTAFSDEDGGGTETSGIYIMIECTEDNKFEYDKFIKEVKGVIQNNKEEIEEYEETDLNSIFEEYNKLYDRVLEFKEEVYHLSHLFDDFSNFY